MTLTGVWGAFGIGCRLASTGSMLGTRLAPSLQSSGEVNSGLLVPFVPGNDCHVYLAEVLTKLLFYATLVLLGRAKLNPCRK
jgi:hypothetical protein